MRAAAGKRVGDATNYLTSKIEDDLAMVQIDQGDINRLHKHFDNIEKNFGKVRATVA